MPSTDRLSIAINAQLPAGGGNGGGESVLIGLTRALGELHDGPEKYILIAAWSAPDLLSPYIGPNQKIVRGPRPSTSPTAGLKRLAQPFGPLLRPLWRRMPHRKGALSWPQLPISSGFYESLGCDVLHFPYQEFVLCSLPTIYNPHDLQHRHFPGFFSPMALAWRESIYPLACRLAHTVAVASDWVKDDIVRQFSLDSSKIQVIPWAPPTQAYPAGDAETTANIRNYYGLDKPFGLYPAMLWKHKNHLRLLQALALLRERDNQRVLLVCTGIGPDHAHRKRIVELVRELNLDQHVKFLDFIPPAHLRAVYKLADFVVVPTLFEAASAPVFEAWQEGVPVACSAVTSLPEQAGGAALLFDPLSVTSIANAVGRIASDQELRERLRLSGRERLRAFSWERTAKAYRAVYRRAGGVHLTEEDKWLLNHNWTKPHSTEPVAI